MQIGPTISTLAPKVVPPGGDTLGGQCVPGGTEIAANPFAILRNKKYFGDDSKLFRPERWMEATAEDRVRMERITELAFGHGKWMCAGKRLAFVELGKVFVEVSCGCPAWPSSMQGLICDVGNN